MAKRAGRQGSIFYLLYLLNLYPLFFMKYNINSEQEMVLLGEKIAANLNGGDIVLLHGNLGAGKTTLTKGIAHELGVTDEITSPTFTLMNAYQIKNPKSKILNLIHIDTYRLENEEQLIEIGVEDYLGDKDTVCVVEWPEKIEGLLKTKKVKCIVIEHGNKGRLIKIED